MNKMITLIFFTWCIALESQSTIKYNFSHRMESYLSIESTGINVTEDFVWDDELFFAPLDFTLNFMGESADGLLGVTNGWFVHPDALMDDFPESVIFLYADYMDLGMNTAEGEPLSPIYVQNTGTVGERVAIVEYNNAGFYTDDPTINDFVNFQFRFYEKDNAIEMHFGPSELNNIQEIFGFFPGPLVSLAYNTSFDTITEDIHLDTFLYVSGNPDSFSAIHSNTATDLNTPGIYFNGWPKENQVFRFTPGMVIANRDVEDTEWNVFPNPFQDKLVLRCNVSIPNTSELQLTNSLGQNIEISTRNISDRMIEIKTDQQLPSGMYLLSALSTNGMVSMSVIKK
ncbi:MAG: T9SS type A sorting domain-containing protein [Saprospiraceae bacterium]|nr:T9SS type A sorting domain-containing protein [Saprospiraceae bacterium]